MTRLRLGVLRSPLEIFAFIRYAARMRRRGSWIVLAVAILLVACAAPRVLTEVELQEKELTDLNATMHALNKELGDVRARQLLLPKGSPGYLAVGREVALLKEKSTKLLSERIGRQMDLEEARRKEAETAITVTPSVSLANTTTNARVVVELGGLRLYPFTVTTDTDQGTKAVTGEVENTSTNALTDVSVAFNVLDAGGQNVGTASDQIATLEPGVRWPFKALVLDNAVDKAEFLEFKIAGKPVTPPAPADGTTTTPLAPGEAPPPSPQNIEKPVSAERVFDLINQMASDTFKGLNGEENNYFGEIAKSGDIGLLPIQHFLAQNLDKQFGKKGLPKPPTTLRQGLLNILINNGSPAAEKVLIEVLSVTGIAEEVFIIEAGLGKISPGKHGDIFQAACKYLINNPPPGFSPKQRGRLEAILAKYKTPRPKRN